MLIQNYISEFYYKKYYFNRFNMAIRQVFGIIPALIIYFLLSHEKINPITGFEMIQFFGISVFFNFIPTIALIVFSSFASDHFHDFWPVGLIFGIYAAIAFFTRQNEPF